MNLPTLLTEAAMREIDVPKPPGLPADHWMHQWKMAFRAPPTVSLVTLDHSSGFSIAFPHIPEGMPPEKVLELMGLAALMFADQSIVDAQAKKTAILN